MIVLPAIDLKDGRCVRLYQGDYGTASQVSDDPLKTAQRFASEGAKWLHMVDLDGAKEGRPVNREIIGQIIKGTKLSVEVGGGIRSLETVEEYLSLGADRVILGSAAIENPDLVYDAVKEFGSKIAVGIDARDGMAAAGGWLKTSDVHYIDLAKAMDGAGVKTLIYTDISRDGTLNGVNLSHLERLCEAVSCDVIASGGVRDIGDIAALRALSVAGVICGKALYQGTLSLTDAIETAEN